MAAANSAAASRKPKTVKVEDFQKRAWEWYDLIPEYRFSCDWVGNVLSKAKLYIAKDGVRIEDEFALDALASLFDGPEGQAEMLRMLGIHMTVAGEGYIIGVSNDNDELADEWMVIASTELKYDGASSYKIGSDPIEDSDPLVIRCYRKHPRKPKQANSPSRPLLDILQEIYKLTQHVAAQLDSRLAGAGLLLLPQEISFPNGPSSDSNEDQSQQQRAAAFLDELMQTMALAIQDRSDPSALVPIILQAPGEFLDKIQNLTFWSELDGKSVELRKEAIGRLAMGMDMPPEVLTGTGDMNHWGSWQVEEASIKSHTEPLLKIITSELTKKFLHPLIEDEVPEEELSSYTFEADTSEMRLRPNRSKEAMELYEKGEISATVLLRENGFDEADIMGEDELKRWFIRKVASGSTTPELVQAALEELGIQFVLPEPIASPTTEARPEPSIADHPVQELPTDTTDPANDAIAAAAEAAVFRALERAGNKIKTKFGLRPPGVVAMDLYQHVTLGVSDADDLLEDAWSTVDRMSLACDKAAFVQCVDSYTRSLLMTRAPHDMTMMRSYLALAKEPA
jgi:hypothetical protein